VELGIHSPIRALLCGLQEQSNQDSKTFCLLVQKAAQFGRRFESPDHVINSLFTKNLKNELKEKIH
jgi:hypothetical protein